MVLKKVLAEIHLPTTPIHMHSFSHVAHSNNIIYPLHKVKTTLNVFLHIAKGEKRINNTKEMFPAIAPSKCFLLHNANQKFESLFEEISWDQLFLLLGSVKTYLRMSENSFFKERFVFIWKYITKIMIEWWLSLFFAIKQWRVFEIGLQKCVDIQEIYYSEFLWHKSLNFWPQKHLFLKHIGKTQQKLNLGKVYLPLNIC